VATLGQCVLTNLLNFVEQDVWFLAGDKFLCSFILLEYAWVWLWLTMALFLGLDTNLPKICTSLYISLIVPPDPDYHTTHIPLS